MATQVSLTIRRNEAYERIAKAVRKLAKDRDIKVDSDLSLRHRDPMMEQVLRIEAVADALGNLAKAKVDDAPAVVAPVPGAAVGNVTVSTVEILPAREAQVDSKPKGKR